MTKIPNEEAKRREDEAWQMVKARETGKVYFSVHEIKTATKVSTGRVRDIVNRCRFMRKVLGFDVVLPDDWWSARMMSLPVGATSKADEPA